MVRIGVNFGSLADLTQTVISYSQDVFIQIIKYSLTEPLKTIHHIHTPNNKNRIYI